MTIEISNTQGWVLAASQFIICCMLVAIGFKVGVQWSIKQYKRHKGKIWWDQEFKG